MTQQSHSWAYTQTKLSLKKTHAPACLLQHYSQQPRHGNNPNAHRQTNGLGRHGIYTQMEYYSAIKKNNIMPFAATWMELETLILSEISQRERQIPYDITYNWNLI